jgi:16S rRNA (uracil1498-N3)-methyltransferase
MGCVLAWGGVFWTFVEPSGLASGKIRIEGAAGHHLGRALRVKEGEPGVVVLGGREYGVQVSAVNRGSVVVEVIEERSISGEPEIAVSLLQALLPNPDFDAVLEAGTEVGISQFIPVEASRSVARQSAGRLFRWRAIARSAAEQSHRGRIPSVSEPTTLADALGQVGQARLLMLDPRAETPLKSGIDGSSRYAIAVGPEGGWTELELDLMRRAGGMAVSLGPRVLRARLAGVIAAAILVQPS